MTTQSTHDFTAIVTEILHENAASLAQIDAEQSEVFLSLLKNAARIFVTGEGRSGLVMRMFAMRLTHLGKSTFMVGDATTPAIQRGDLLVVCSGSGETTIPCLRAERAVSIGATVVAIGGRAYSRLIQSAALTIFLPQSALPDQTQTNRTVQFGGSRFEQCALLFCDVIAYLAMMAWEIDPATMQGRHANLE